MGIKKAMELALEHLEYIIDHRTAPDFVEVTGRVGGDGAMARFDYNKENFETVSVCGIKCLFNDARIDRSSTEG